MLFDAAGFWRTSRQDGSLITQTAGQTDIRAVNLAVVLGHLRREAPCSRAAIAAATGLNKATVTSIVGDLIDRRLVRETQQTRNQVGRPATLLVLDGSAYAAIGLELSAHGLAALAYDTAGDQVLRWHRTGPGADARPGKAIAALAALARRAISTVESSGRQVLGITVGVPGLVDHAGVVVLAAGLDWHDVPLEAELRTALRRPDIPLHVGNDATLGALAEHTYGRRAGSADLVHVTGDTGIGAGIIVGGRLVQGNLGYAGEIGHLRMVPDGPECGCGRSGCLEALASLPAILRRTDTDPDLDPHLQLDSLIRRADSGEPSVTKVLTEAGSQLGYGLGTLVNLLDPAAIILGGGYARLAPYLLPALTRSLAEASVAPTADGRVVEASTLAGDAVSLGGVAQAFATLSAGKLPAPA
jgi:predicted NBD/HSP70 family sugar kinase